MEDAYHGAARTISLQTPELDTRGHVLTRERTLNVRIPKGIREGQQIRLTGQGSPGLTGGHPGDLYLKVEFRPHRLYRIEGRDLYLLSAFDKTHEAFRSRSKLLNLYTCVSYDPTYEQKFQTTCTYLACSL